MRIELSFPAAALAACALVACAPAPSSSASATSPRSTAMSMSPSLPARASSTDANKRLVHRLYDEYINPGHLDRLGEIVAPDFVGPAPQPGPAGFAASMAALREGFPDLAYRVDDLLAEGDRVMVRWTLTGTHTGPFRTFAASGKKIVSTGFAVFRVANGKLAQASVETDRLGFLMAIGAVPYDPAFGPPPATPR